MVEKTSSEAAASLTKADAATTEKLGRHRREPAVRALSVIGKLGDQPELRTLSASLIALGLLLRDKRLSRAGLRMLVAHEVATAAKDFIKNRVDRTRPGSAADNRQAKARPGRSKAKKDTSFPSGHSAGSMAVARAFGREFPRHRASATAVAGLVGVAQIPKQAHYPTDVAAGAAIGAVSEALLGKLWPAPSADEPGDEPAGLA